MRVGELLHRIDRKGITLTLVPGEDGAPDKLNAKPTEALTPKLIEHLREHKPAILKILREDEEMRCTGILQCERQVFDLAREFFGLDTATEQRGGG